MSRSQPLAHSIMWSCFGSALLVAVMPLLPESNPTTTRSLVAVELAPPVPSRPPRSLTPVEAWERAQRQSFATATHAVAHLRSLQQGRSERWGDRPHLVVDLSRRRVYLFQNRELYASYPVGIGQPGWETPTGSFQVLSKLKNPVWQQPLTGVDIKPGEANPLGDRWVEIWSNGKAAIGFHGTNDLASVGQPVSHGCLRMRNADVRSLYDWVEVGTPVEIQP